MGRPSAFVGMQVGQAINIEWNREKGVDLEIDDADDEDNAAISF